MKTSRLLPILGLLVPIAFGCKKKEAPQAEPAPSAAPAPEPAAPVTTATAQAATASDLPTVEDFEEEAAEDITLENMEAELDKLEKEINE